MFADARSWKWLWPCVCGSLLSCGGTSSQQDATTQPGLVGAQSQALSEAFYAGTLKSTFQVVDITTATTQVVTVSMPAWVLIQAPFSFPMDGTESNPFHMEIGPGHAVPQRPPGAPPLPPGTPQAPPTPPGTLPVPGEIFFTSATLQPNNNTTGPFFTVVPAWSYTFNQANQSFSGQLQSPLTIDVNNLFGGAEIGGPSSIPPNVKAEPCLAGINNGATVTGSFSGNQVQVTVKGTAGGFNGPTCLTQFQFETTITATISQGLVSSEASEIYNGDHAENALLSKP